MKVLISKDKNKKEFRHPLLKIVYEDAYIIVVEKKEGLLSVGTERQKERTAQHILSEYVSRSGTRKPHLRGSSPRPGYFGINDVCQRRKDTIHVA